MARAERPSPPTRSGGTPSCPDGRGRIPPRCGCSSGHKEAADGLPHRHRSWRVHHVRDLHGRVPGRGPGHEPSRCPGCRNRPWPRAPAHVDDGAPAPGGRVHRLRHLHPRMPAQRDVVDHAVRRGAARGSAGSDRPPGRSSRRRMGPAVAGHPRGAQARPRLAVGRPVHLADAVAAQGVAGLDVDGRRRATEPTRSLPGGVPGRHRRGAVRGPDRGRPLRRGVRRRRGGQPLSLGVRLDLHRAVRGRMPSRRAGRTDRDQDPQALRGRAGQAARGRAADGAPFRAGGDRWRRARRHVSGLVPGPPRVPRHRARGDARARRHDGDRHPRVSAAARCAPGGDRADPRGRGRAATGHGHGPRLRPGRPRARGVQGDLPRDRRLQEPAPRGPRRRAARGHPGNQVPQGGQPRRVAPPVGRRRRRRRRQHRHGRGAVGTPERRSHRDHRLSPGAPRHARPGRGDRGGRARGHRGPRRPRAGRGRRPQRGRGRRSLRRHARARRRSPGRARQLGVDGRDPRAPGELGPRRHRRGARPVDPARRCRHRGQRLGGDRGRSPDARHGPRRDLRGRRRRVGAAHDHRGSRRRTPRRGVHPRVPRGCPGRRGGDPRGRAVSDGAGDLAQRRPRRLVPGSARRCRSWTSGRSRLRRVASPTPRRMPRPAGASGATRCTAARPSRSWPAEVPGAARDRDAIPIPAARPADQPAQGGVQ